MVMALTGLSLVISIINNPKHKIIKLLLLTICSASTELGFIITLMLSLGYLVIHNLKKSTFFNKYMFFILTSEILGFLTIFLSPASRNRAISTKTIFNYPFFKLIYENFDDFAQTIIGENSIAIIIGFLIIAISVLAIHDKNINKILRIGLPLGIIIFVIQIFQFFNIFTSIVITCAIIVFIVYAIIELFKFDSYKILSIFLVAGACSQGASFCLGEISYRTLLELTIICIICAANIFTIILHSLKKSNIKDFSLFAVILLCCTLPNFLQIFIGYYNNNLIINSSLQSIKNYNSNEIIEINTNIDKNYAHTMGYENGAFEEYYFKYYGIDEYKNDIYFVNNKDSIILLNGKRLRYPAMYDNDKMFIPFRFAVEAMNGECNWTTEKTIYSTGDYFLVIDNSTQIILDSHNEDIIGTNIAEYIHKFFDRTYIEKDYFKKIFSR